MKAVAGNKHLYLRKQWFYFRMKLPKRLGTREVRIALHTQNLISAVNKLNQIKPYVQQIKQLVIASKSLETSEVQPQLLKIKDAMLKQLQVSDIDTLIADVEQGYSNGAHALNVLGQSELLSDDNQFKEQLTYIAQATDNETRTKRLQEIIAGLSEDEQWPFMDALSSMVKVLVGLTDEVEELAEAAISHAIGLYVFDDIDINKTYIGQSRSNIVDRLDAHFRDTRTYMKNVTHILPVSIAPGVTDKLTDVLDVLEQSFIDELDGPGGRKGQSGSSANKRNQINFKNKQRKHLEVLMNKFKVCD